MSKSRDLPADPVIGLIEAHRRAYRAIGAADLDLPGNADLGARKAAEKLYRAALKTEREIIARIEASPPATIASARALLDYALSVMTSSHGSEISLVESLLSTLRQWTAFDEAASAPSRAP